MGGKPRRKSYWRGPKGLFSLFSAARNNLYALCDAGSKHVQVLHAVRVPERPIRFKPVSARIRVEDTEVLRGDYSERHDFAVVLRDAEVLLFRDGVAVEEHAREWEAKRKRGWWHGQLRRLRQIGERLYAVGDRGQIYMRPLAGRWKRIAPPEREGRELDVFDIAQYGERVVVAGLDRRDRAAWIALVERLGAEAYLKHKTSNAAIWSLDGEWSERLNTSDAECCFALDQRSPIAWLSLGKRLELTDSGTTVLEPVPWPARIVATSSHVLVETADRLYRTSTPHELEPMPPTGGLLPFRFLGASSESVAVTTGEEVHLCHPNWTCWERLDIGEAAAKRPPALRVHSSFGDFLAAYSSLYGNRASVASAELAAWTGVAEESTGRSQPGDESNPAYWFHDLASLYGEAAMQEAAHDDYIWGDKLLGKGYPIGIGYGGDLFIQSVFGPVYHVHRDDWIEDEDTEALSNMSVEEFFREWGHHYLADDFRSFYAMLCRERGTNTASR